MSVQVPKIHSDFWPGFTACLRPLAAASTAPGAYRLGLLLCQQIICQITASGVMCLVPHYSPIAAPLHSLLSPAATKQGSPGALRRRNWAPHCAIHPLHHPCRPLWCLQNHFQGGTGTRDFLWQLVRGLLAPLQCWCFVPWWASRLCSYPSAPGGLLQTEAYTNPASSQSQIRKCHQLIAPDGIVY